MENKNSYEILFGNLLQDKDGNLKFAEEPLEDDPEMMKQGEEYEIINGKKLGNKTNSTEHTNFAYIFRKGNVEKIDLTLKIV